MPGNGGRHFGRWRSDMNLSTGPSRRTSLSTCVLQKEVLFAVIGQDGVGKSGKWFTDPWFKAPYADHIGPRV